MIVFQIHAKVAPERAAGFENRVTGAFLPVVRRQPGFRGATLLRLYRQQPGNPPDLVGQGFSHQIELRFTNEQARAAWAASSAHAQVWPTIREVAHDVRSVGYDRVAGAAGGSEPEWA